MQISSPEVLQLQFIGLLYEARSALRKKNRLWFYKTYANPVIGFDNSAYGNCFSLEENCTGLKFSKEQQKAPFNLPIKLIFNQKLIDWLGTLAKSIHNHFGYVNHI